jgi:hypothetical protein
MNTTIIFITALIGVAIISFVLGAEYVRYKIRKNLEDSYFGTMILNMNLKDNDNFVETRFNHNPRELLGREMVLFDIKIRE